MFQPISFLLCLMHSLHRGLSGFFMNLPMGSSISRLSIKCFCSSVCSKIPFILILWSVLQSLPKLRRKFVPTVPSIGISVSVNLSYSSGGNFMLPWKHIFMLSVSLIVNGVLS
uniref:Putative secreted protein n=1 Tax=Ixodes ricinus TaxID=34613 RepID=A0A6B0UK03_IXORI